MREPNRIWLFATLLALSVGAVQGVSPPKPEASPKPLTRAEIAKLPIPPEARAELIVKASPNDVQARFDAAQAYLHAPRDTPQNVAAAERHLGELLKLAPNNFGALLLAGDAALRRSQPLTAASHYQRAVRINPDHAGLQLRLGEALQRVGDIKGSNAAYDAYRRLNHLPPLKRQEAAKTK